MKHTRIQQLLSSYGTDPARWPASERITAQQLAVLSAQDPELAAAVADATAVDAALDELDREHGVVDDLRTQRLLQSLQTRVQSLPQVAYVQRGRQGEPAEQIEVPPQRVTNPAVLPRATRARRQRSYSLAWAALLPLMFGFLAGLTSEVGETYGLLERTLVQTVPDASSSVDANYADETMLAPFVAAAEFSTDAGAHN